MEQKKSEGEQAVEEELKKAEEKAEEAVQKPPGKSG
jgi:hypothetical protein